MSPTFLYRRSVHPRAHRDRQPRWLLGPLGAHLQYNLFLDAGHATIWGDGVGPTGLYGPWGERLGPCLASSASSAASSSRRRGVGSA